MVKHAGGGEGGALDEPGDFLDKTPCKKVVTTVGAGHIAEREREGIRRKERAVTCSSCSVPSSAPIELRMVLSDSTMSPGVKSHKHP